MSIDAKEQRRPHRDQYFYVLDYLPSGSPAESRQAHGREPVAQVIGEEYFTLLEVVPLEGIAIKTGDRIFVGRGPEDRLYSQVSRVVRPITYNDLSMVAKRELENILEMIVDINEARFVDFFNNAKPLTVKMHQLELIPGIGKKLMWEILAEREKQPFKSIDDLQTRIKVIGIKKKIIERILSELQGNEKYRIFVMPP
jgi:putative nucleotide binding protein